jgi:arabinofuranan 3-O-arabinosyltransferase
LSPAFRRRLREAVPTAILAVTIYLPLLLTRPGRVGADTKSYLYLDPGRMLSRAPTMWDPNIGLGTVTHQNIGYLWPIGPWYWLADALGMPDWVAQRLWLGTILFAAGLGVRYMLKAMGQEGPHVTAATFCYALTPYILTLAARLSVILLPYAGLPWLIGLTVVSLRRRRWREPALFALVVATIGSVNATALILCGVGPLLWIFHEVAVTREVRFRDAMAVVGRIGVLTVGCSLWWLSGLWAQGGYGIEILRFTETAETVAMASLALEVLRGLGYWFFYGEDRYGPWIEPSRGYMDNPLLLAVSYAIPTIGLLGAAAARFRERMFFLLLLALGLFLAVGAHPWDDPAPANAAIKAFLQSELGLSMRSLPRAAPLVVLALSVFAGALIAAISARRPRLARPLTAGLVGLSVLALPPLWRGQLVDANLDRAEEIPGYWTEAAAALDARDDGSRVLEVPGSDFASYRWGNTVDPVLPGLMDRPYVARELIPYGSPASANLLNAFDHRLQEQIFDAEALAPMARFLAAGDISVRSDLSYERFNTPRPRTLWQLLSTAPGILETLGFGPSERNTPRPELPLLDEQALLTPPSLPDPPEVGVLGIEDPEKIVRTAPTDRPVVLAGDGDGIVDAASAGLLTGHELVLYSASFAGDDDALREQIDRDSSLVLTDTNRRAARRWGTVRDNTGITERAGQTALVRDWKDQRLDVFEQATDDHATVTEARGGVWADATSYGNSVSLTPEDDPAFAVDGDVNTAWRTGGFSAATGERLQLTYREPVRTDRITLLQAVGGVRTRTIARVGISFDGGPSTTYDLDASSRSDQPADDGTAGQVITFPTRTFRTLDLTIEGTDPDALRRYDGISAVGFAEVVVTDEDGTRPVGDDVVRLPTDLLDAAGADAIDHPLAVILTRLRVAGTVAVRSDPERSMARTFSLPDARSFAVTGQVRLSNRSVGDNVVDAALGLPGAEDGGVTATSSRRLPGGLVNRSMAAIDGDPKTWWSPGFLDQGGEFVDYVAADPVTVDQLELTLLNDGRHSVPRSLEVAVGEGDDLAAQTVDLPEIEDQATENGAVTVSVRLPRAVSGRHIRITVPEGDGAVRDVETLDWFTGRPLIMPIGLVELGIEGLTAPELPARVDDSCRDDLLEVDGEGVALSISGTTADLLAGEALTAVACDAEGLELPEGTTTLRTARADFTGFDLDRLVLRSDAGGAADPDRGPLVPGSRPGQARPDVQIDTQGRTTVDATVREADEPFWFVLGQSYNPGWNASANGTDLGPPTLVNGYANGWEVPAGTNIDLHLEWTPQRVVWGAIWLSVASILVALVLVLRPQRAVAADEIARVPLDARPSMPRPIQAVRLLRYAGPTPSRFALVATVVAALVAGIALVDPLAGVGLAALAALALRVPRSRPLLVFGGPGLFALSALALIVRQARYSLPTGFDWPTYYDVLQGPAWMAVLVLLLDAVVDRCWLRRWWPTEDSPA